MQLMRFLKLLRRPKKKTPNLYLYTFLRNSYFTKTKPLGIFLPIIPMTLLFSSLWISISINIILVLHIIVSLLLVLVVLMQKPKQEGLGAAFGSGLTDQAFGARTTDVLQKSTIWLGTIFFVLTLTLAILITKQQKSNPSLVNYTSKSPVPMAKKQPLPSSKNNSNEVVFPEILEKKDATQLPNLQESNTPQQTTSPLPNTQPSSVNPTESPSQDTTKQ